MEMATPGPWSVVGDESYTIQNLEIDEIVVWEMGGIDNRVNAYQIAAVPDLLAACLYVDRILTQRNLDGWEQSMRDIVRHALAKARGETT